MTQNKPLMLGLGLLVILAALYFVNSRRANQAEAVPTPTPTATVSLEATASPATSPSPSVSPSAKATVSPKNNAVSPSDEPTQ